MDAKMRGKKIKTELEFKKWFEKEFKRLGFSKIVKKDNGTFPDYIMLKGDKEIKVELETLLSNFILHKHRLKDVDEVICIKKDINLDIPVKEVRELEFIGNKQRISATVDKETKNMIDILIKVGNYRNKSHVIEEAIRLLAKKNENK